MTDEAAVPSDPRNVVIMGSGCAGLTAAIYAARANLRPLVVEGRSPGGQLAITTDVENYPGFPEGIQGPELIDHMRRQAQRFGAEFLSGAVTKANLERRPFTISVEGETEVRTRALIVATGADAILLGLENERALIGHGVSTCATCDGFFFRDREIAVIGGGDSAMEEGTFLTKFASKVHLVHRRDSLRASKIMQDRARANPKIVWHWDTLVDSYASKDGKLVGLELRNLKTGKASHLPVEGAFIAIGHKPATEVFGGALETDPKGYLLVRPGMRTNVEGVFAAGDVHDREWRQAVTAAGAGCAAAIACERWLESQHA